MDRRLILFTSFFALVVLLLSACSGATTPTATGSNSSNLTGVSAAGFETQSNSSGSVTVDVKPTALEVGKPMTFDIALNTHSVDLSNDITKTTFLRDDSGREYPPIAWDGSGRGGHHRAGTLTFAAFTSKPRFIELVIKGLAGVPERAFRWNW